MSVWDKWGMRCPRCKRDDGLLIDVTVGVRLTEHGTEAMPGQEHEWDDDSPCSCEECGWSGQVINTDTDDGAGVTTPTGQRLLPNLNPDEHKTVVEALAVLEILMVERGRIQSYQPVVPLTAQQVERLRNLIEKSTTDV